MTAKELKQITQCGETSRVQFKLKFSNQKQLAAEVIAFANSKGGMILFGVEDKTGEIAGLSYDEIQQTARELGNTYQRNQLIAGLCAKTMLYRGLGSGIIRAMREGTKIEFINDESGNQFSSIIYRDIVTAPSTEEQEHVPSLSQVCPKYVPSMSQAKTPFVPSLSQVCPKLEHEFIETAVRVLCACREKQSMQQLMQIAGDKNRTRLRKNIISPLLDCGLLEPIIKNVTRSPKQGYVITDKGRQFII